MKIISNLTHLNPVYFERPLSSLIVKFLQKKGVKADIDLIDRKLRQHPHFPSLLSINDILSSLGFCCTAFKTDIETLKANFESAVLLKITDEEGMFAILDRVQNQRFRIITENGQTKWRSENEFQASWSEGILFDIEGEPKVNLTTKDLTAVPKSLKRVILLLSGTIAAFLLLKSVSDLNISRAILLGLNLFGAMISWILVLQHLNQRNALVEQLCDTNTNKGCSSVLSDKSASLTPWLSMAEIGFVYFSCMSLVSLFLDLTSPIYLIIYVVPFFSIYAVYLQAYVIRQWCKLCLAVHGIALALLLTYSSSQSTILWLFPPLNHLILFFLPGMIWVYVKPVIQQFRSGKYYEATHAKLKYDPTVFTALITRGPKFYIPANLKVFTLGNENSKNEITIVSNPFCGPCARAHAILEEWLDEGADFRINIIINRSKSNWKKMQLFSEFLSEISSAEQLKEALNNWFNASDKNLNKWAAQHNLKPGPLIYSQEELAEWLDLTEVHATPTIFINGYKLPKTLPLSDIRFLIPELEEQDKILTRKNEADLQLTTS